MCYPTSLQVPLHFPGMEAQLQISVNKHNFCSTSSISVNEHCVGNQMKTASFMEKLLLNLCVTSTLNSQKPPAFFQGHSPPYWCARGERNYRTALWDDMSSWKCPSMWSLAWWETAIAKQMSVDFWKIRNRQINQLSKNTKCTLNLIYSFKRIKVKELYTIHLPLSLFSIVFSNFPAINQTQGPPAGPDP